ncbi:MAG: RagB/SusD family nutrient uptake outer membrane protein [Tannerella sp.]|nr:RagB/SusD family nutrient uptake outer membrane protein [Tannerella sp.]
MKKMIVAMGLLSLLAGVAGCKDGKYLEEHPETFYSVDNAFSSSAQVDQVLISLYKHIRELWANPSENQWIYVLKGNGTDMYDVPNIRKSNNFIDYGVINPGHDHFYQIYTTWYYVISRANTVLYAAELPQVTFASESEKTYMIAQARFFRAFAYKSLAELFGGVPIVTEIVSVPKYDYTRASRIETYQFAIDELEAIENDMPETTASGGRLVRGAAQHNLAELYLATGIQMAEEGKVPDAQNAFAKSIAYANKVIDGNTYSLIKARYGTRMDERTVSTPVYMNGEPGSPVDTTLQATNYYWDMFQEGNVNYQEGNTECIWAVQIDYAAYKAEDRSSVLPHTRAYGQIFRIGAEKHLTGMLEDVGGRGITWILPTWYTRDLIYEGKWGVDMRNSDIVFRRRFKGNVSTSPYFKQIVPWEEMYNGSPDPAVNSENASLCYPQSCKITTDRFTGLTDGEIRSSLFRDEYVIRLPETILLRAEAKQRSGDKAGAAADINLLRERAQCTYPVTASDVDDNFDLILDERARELVYEEMRWNTLLRMGGTVAVDRIRKYAWWPEAKATLTFNYNLFPIPQLVIDTNTGVKLEQNPGWTNR